MIIVIFILLVQLFVWLFATLEVILSIETGSTDAYRKAMKALPRYAFLYHLLSLQRQECEYHNAQGAGDLRKFQLNLAQTDAPDSPRVARVMHLHIGDSLGLYKNPESLFIALNAA